MDGCLTPAPRSPPVLRRRLEVGRRLREAREYRNLSQPERDELAGVDFKPISRIETGSVTPLLDTLLVLADALAISPQQLLPQWPRPPGG
ncbi:helix-turn-helix domain-containing protein [Streptomyces sp. NBC_01803]|uniref:helix-turn-helix domain-containing protein n=1 Tax=Streptomyces sp. NBC_01803 TaxID=2975946 RepID=UPI002DD9620B|nr:helix-turn-helix transcriptional regulator [Streptomyces sp. NBC_01803]WSA44529.1 helix-turn-helix domain-containing protein [Streptomyces sp. NBC_01803]